MMVLMMTVLVLFSKKQVILSVRVLRATTIIHDKPVYMTNTNQPIACSSCMTIAMTPDVIN